MAWPTLGFWRHSSCGRCPWILVFFAFLVLRLRNEKLEHPPGVLQLRRQAQGKSQRCPAAEAAPFGRGVSRHWSVAPATRMLNRRPLWVHPSSRAAERAPAIFPEDAEEGRIVKGTVLPGGRGVSAYIAPRCAAPLPRILTCTRASSQGAGPPGAAGRDRRGRVQEDRSRPEIHRPGQAVQGRSPVRATPESSGRGSRVADTAASFSYAHPQQVFEP